MQGRIEFLGKYYDVTVYGRFPHQQVQIGDAAPQVAVLDAHGSGRHEIKLGPQHAGLRMVIKGEKAYIRAFDRTFTLTVVNPVEQAGMGTGGSSRRAMAPMPGVVVEIHVAEGEPIAKGKPMMTIESMKILTAIPAPSNGKIEQIHFTPGQPFEKGAALVTLCPEEK